MNKEERFGSFTEPDGPSRLNKRKLGEQKKGKGLSK